MALPIIKLGPSPKKAEWVDVVANAAPRLDALVGKWFDSIPAEVRAELHSIYEPMIDLLVRAGMRK